jgi:hypothetical protein
MIAKAGLQLETQLPTRPKNEKPLVHSRSPGAKPIHEGLPWIAMSTAPTIITGPSHFGIFCCGFGDDSGVIDSCGERFPRFEFSFCSQKAMPIMRSSNRKSSRHTGGVFALLAALVVQGVLAATPVPPAPLTDAEKIEALILAVEARKDLQFIRLDTAHTAGEAASMLRVKLAFAGDRVKTVDDFIDHVATATQSGKPYFVRYADGKEVSSAEFLRQELKRIERAPAVGRATKSR